MSITISKLLEHDLLNPNLWEFFFTEDNSLRFLVKSTTLPFIKFETETRPTGDKFIKSYVPEEGFSITFSETTDFKVYQFFKDWQDSIYDKSKRVFKNNKYTKDAVLSLMKYDDVYTASFQFSDLMFLGFENVDWDYTGTEGKDIVCTFSVDSVDNVAVVIPK